MSAKPWEKWTVEKLREQALDAAANGFFGWSHMLSAFADLKEAEQRGERCVLPKEVEEKEMNCLCGGGRWIAWEHGAMYPQGEGQTQQAAIEDLARKIKEGM